MKIQFFKYQGTGNDFILLDNRDGHIQLSGTQIARLCDRRFGIGADGLMLLENAPAADFHMVYYNSDGNESTMCGNGGRCLTAFALKLGLVAENAAFTAIDGPHAATLLQDGTIALQMQDVTGIKHFNDHSELNTGSPHYILDVADAAAVNVFEEGRKIRHNAVFEPKGINVNFVQQIDDTNLFVRTYERGVEAETYSCGTGVTAAAIASTGAATGDFLISIRTPGGDLKVSFTKDNKDTARNVVLTGPAVFVFEGAIDLQSLLPADESLTQ